MPKIETSARYFYEQVGKTLTDHELEEILPVAKAASFQRSRNSLVWNPEPCQSVDQTSPSRPCPPDRWTTDGHRRAAFR